MNHHSWLFIYSGENNGLFCEIFLDFNILLLIPAEFTQPDRLC